MPQGWACQRQRHLGEQPQRLPEEPNQTTQRLDRKSEPEEEEDPGKKQQQQQQEFKTSCNRKFVIAEHAWKIWNEYKKRVEDKKSECLSF